VSDPWKRKEVIGDAVLYLGDCLEILPTLPKVDAVVTDPPYGIGFKYGDAYKDSGGDEYMHLIASLRGYPLALLQYPEEMMRYVVPILGAPDECFIWCYNSMNERQSRIWGFWGIEPDWSQVKQPAKNPLDRRITAEQVNGGVRHYDWCSDLQQVKNVSEEKTSHPCQLPTALTSRIIRFCQAHSILDPFMGSGTTGVACMNLGRKFIGIEIEPKYFDIACERITNAQRQVRMFA
jgi:DNA modification methylase